MILILDVVRIDLNFGICKISLIIRTDTKSLVEISFLRLVKSHFSLFQNGIVSFV